VSNGLKEQLEAAFARTTVTDGRANEYLVSCEKESVLSVLAWLKDSGYDHLALVSCVDRPALGQLELVFVLSAYMQEDGGLSGREKLNVILKTALPRDNPECQTATHVFEIAEPYERELHELFGINFRGHKRLTPLFLEREYEIPPFRKDFDTRAYVKDLFDNIPAIEESKE
jgi:NADH-quinone oxidoreductase subunit C